MITASMIKSHLPNGDMERPLIHSVELEWHQQLETHASAGVLVIRTTRELTSDGGNGWHGFDATDLSRVHVATTCALQEAGALGHISWIIVRAA